jgi:hypothetical protein
MHRTESMIGGSDLNLDLICFDHMPLFRPILLSLDPKKQKKREKRKKQIYRRTPLGTTPRTLMVGVKGGRNAPNQRGEGEGKERGIRGIFVMVCELRPKVM